METKVDELQVMEHLTTPPTTGTSFSQLLLEDDNDNDNELVLGDGGVDQTFSTSFFSLHNTPKMLCFGNYQNEMEIETNLIITPRKSVITSSDSSSASSCNHANTGFNSLTTTTTKPNVCFYLRMMLVLMVLFICLFSLSKSYFFIKGFAEKAEWVRRRSTRTWDQSRCWRAEMS
jgi:hypothetical protein